MALSQRKAMAAGQQAVCRSSRAVAVPVRSHRASSRPQLSRAEPLAVTLGRRMSVAAASGAPQAPQQPSVPAQFVEGAGGDAELEAFTAGQRKAPRPSPAEESRTWFSLAKFGTLATLSSSSEAQGYPQASVVEFAVDEAGKPVLCASVKLSPHGQDLQADGRFALTVNAPGFASMADGRATLQGRVRAAKADEVAAARAAFLAKNPDAFWVDFGDFVFFVTEEVKAVRFVGGFGSNKKMSGEEYLGSKPDPVAKFAAPVCGHMNDDHQADMTAMVAHYCGLREGVEKVKLTGLDRLGLNGEVVRKGATLKLRMAFPSPAEDRKAIKDQIVEMTKTARKAAGAASS